MSTFGTQHAKQEIARPSERHRAFSPGFLIPTVIVILIVLVAILYTPFKRAFLHAEIFAQEIELRQLELAISKYIESSGEAPPSAISLPEIKSHAMNAQHRTDIGLLNLDNFAHDIATLDEREALVFWLGGEAWQCILDKPHRDAYFEFEPTRLTDEDNDGWPEYTDGNGNFFILRNGMAMLYNVSAETVYSIDDLVNEGARN